MLADVWWSAETWYSDRAERIMGEAGCRSVLLAMPELFAGSAADEVWNPTDYLTDRDRRKLNAWKRQRAAERGRQ